MKGSFFCEACGAVVNSRSDSCPSCGRSFMGVRCSKCGKEGSLQEFKGGCPECGYMSEVKPAGLLNSWPEKRHYRHGPDWPASRYWILSAMVFIGLGLIMYLWLR